MNMRDLLHDFLSLVIVYNVDIKHFVTYLVYIKITCVYFNKAKNRQ
ncbi:hypothetical protein ASN88_00741 [Streptococcus parauberis]|nr:hypothetical protein ASN88_00741 [Streptococcus parauberis]